jgi:hypothetical protein
MLRQELATVGAKAFRFASLLLSFRETSGGIENTGEVFLFAGLCFRSGFRLSIRTGCGGWFGSGRDTDGSCSLLFTLTLPVSIVDSQSLAFEFVEGHGTFDGEHVVFDAFGEAVIESLVKCSVIPLDVRGQLSEIGHVAIDMMGVKHFEVSNSSLGNLDDVGLAEKTIKFVAKNPPTTPNGRLGVESKKRLPPDQGDGTEVGCCIGGTLSFVLELSRLVVEDHGTAGDERSEKTWFLAGEFVRLAASESPSGTACGYANGY